MWPINLFNNISWCRFHISAVLLVCLTTGTRAISVELMLELKPQFQWRKTTISVKKNHSFLWRKITISEEEIDSWYWGKNHRRLFMSWQAGSSRTAQVSGLTNGCHLLWLLSAAGAGAILKSTFKLCNTVIYSVCWVLLQYFSTSASALSPLCNTDIYSGAILSPTLLVQYFQTTSYSLSSAILWLSHVKYTVCSWVPSTLWLCDCTFISASCVGCAVLS